MRYLSNEVAKDLVMLDIENRKKVLEMIPDVEEVINRFDGKVLNKRLEKALREVIEEKHDGNYIIVSFRNDYMDIQFNMLNDTVKGEKDSSGYHRYYYIDDRFIYILNGSINNFTNEEKRINAAAMVECIEKYKETFERDIEKWTKSLEEIEEYRKQFEELEKQFKELDNKIPYKIKRYFDLDYEFKSR